MRRTPLRAFRTITATTSLAAAAAAALLAGAGSAAPRATRTCHGLPVTVAASKGTVVGTSGRDVISLTGPVTVYAGKGADVICGSPGNDVIHAGPGDDVVVGRQGHDTIDGGPGADHLYGEQGRDHLIGGPGADILMGGSGHDRVERGSARGANESQAGDSVVPGDMAISLVIDPATRTSLINNTQGFGTAWVPATPAPRTTGASIIAPPLANTIAFQRAYSVWAMPYVPGGAFEPGAQAGFAGSPQQRSTVPGGVTMTTDPLGETAVLAPAPATPGVPGIVVRNDSLNTGMGGLLMSSSTNGQGWWAAPVQSFLMTPRFGFAITPPSTLDLFVGNWGAVWSGLMISSAPSPSIRVSFGGDDEVVDVSYAATTGFSRG